MENPEHSPSEQPRRLSRRNILLTIGGAGLLTVLLSQCTSKDSESIATRDIRRRVTAKYDQVVSGNAPTIEVNGFTIPRQLLTSEFRQAVIIAAMEDLQRHCSRSFERSIGTRLYDLFAGENHEREDLLRIFVGNAVKTRIILELERRGIAIEDFSQ